MKKDKKYMKKAIKLAQKGEGDTSPNPLVGAVVVKEDKIIGTGYHKYFGGPHAEVYALEEAGEEAEGATIYVNLEPCCHWGKTPPCSQKIIRAGIKRVVIGMTDPNPRVSGKGIANLEKEGLEVKTGVLEKETQKLNEIFIKYQTSNFPFIILKTASTLDGFLATSAGHSQWITNEKARQYGHRLRHKVDAIVVGIGTVLSDNPRLTTRLTEGKGKDSVRIVLDSRLRTPPTSRIINKSSAARTILVTDIKNRRNDTDKYQQFQQKDKVELMEYEHDEKGKIPVKKLLSDLYQQNISSILVEGGGRVNYSFLQEGLIDKMYAFVSPKLLGGSDGIALFQGKGPLSMENITQINNIEFEKLGDNFLIKGYLN